LHLKDSYYRICLTLLFYRTADKWGDILSFQGVFCPAFNQARMGLQAGLQAISAATAHVHNSYKTSATRAVLFCTARYYYGFVDGKQPKPS
jgi:hypothetical protein